VITKAISIRQPWAWLIVNGHKDVENRTRRTKFTGPLWIHASATMTKADYFACTIFIAGFAGRWRLPAYDILRDEFCGGIVGSATLVNCVDHSDSLWFTGPFGYVLAEARSCLFTPCKGQLNFFTPNYEEYK